MEKGLISGQFSDVEKTGKLLQASVLPEEIRDIYEEIFASSEKIFAAIDRIKKYLADRKEIE